MTVDALGRFTAGVEVEAADARARRYAALGESSIQATLLGEAFENAPIAAIVLDDAGNYVAANRAACELTGYSRAELLALGLHRTSADAAGVNDRLAEVAAGRLTGGRARLRRKDGSECKVDYRVGETRTAGVPFYVSVFWAAD